MATWTIVIDTDDPGALLSMLPLAQTAHRTLALPMSDGQQITTRLTCPTGEIIAAWATDATGRERTSEHDPLLLQSITRAA